MAWACALVGPGVPTPLPHSQKKRQENIRVERKKDKKLLREYAPHEIVLDDQQDDELSELVSKIMINKASKLSLTKHKSMMHARLSNKHGILMFSG